MSENQSSYRHILKATSIFGGVQILTILIGMIRVKFVAVLLGTAGVGTMGLLNSPLQLILSITGLGIAFSAVRDISEANSTGEQTKISKAITTLRRWAWFTGLLGLLITVVLSPLLSKWSFGNYNYTWAFIILSLTIYIQTISKSQSAILQGTSRLKDLAKASVLGSLIGLLTAAPLFYFFGIQGIVPALAITAVSALIISWYFSRKVKIEPIVMSFGETIRNGKSMVRLGIIMTVVSIITTLTGYILNAFISRTGGVDQVGLYNAGYSIILQSTDLVFTAMATDYFPRLAAVNQDDSKVSLMVNQQAEMSLIILAPLLILLIGSMPILIRILYAPAFLSIIIFANWMIMGIILKGLVWSIGFIFPAKGDLKAFGFIEIITLIFNLLTNILGYKFFGLEGLGVSFILDYIFGLTLSLFIAKRKYKLKLDEVTVKQFFLGLILVISAFLISYFIKSPARYFYIGLVFIISASISIYELDKRVGIRSLITDIVRRH